MPAAVCVQGPTISCGRRPAACSAWKSSTIQGRKMSCQPPTSWTGARMSPTADEKSRSLQYGLSGDIWSVHSRKYPTWLPNARSSSSATGTWS